MTTIKGPRAEPDCNAIALRRIVAAADAIGATERPTSPAMLALAQQNLRKAVQAAHGGGV